MKTNIRNAAWTIGVLLLAGFCLVGCDRHLDVRTVYPFRVTTMPIPKSIVPDEEVEIRCTLAPERIVKGARYTLRYFQYDGKASLCNSRSATASMRSGGTTLANSFSMICSSM